MANETILVVDDDTKSQKVLEVSFKKSGYRVVITNSLEDARARLEQFKPSLIISETRLPDGDGLEFCADIKLDARWKTTPFLFLTDDRSLTQKMRSFELGADDYLTKPVYIKEVTTRVQLLLQRRAKDMLSESDIEEFESNLSDLTMIDMLQTIEEELRSGSILIERAGHRAAIYFREGNVLDAICGKLQGEEAVYRVMLWSEGELIVRYHDNIRRADHIEKNSSTLLLEGIRRLDQFNDLITTLPERNRICAADYQRLPGLLADLPPAVERVLRLFDGYRNLGDVIDDSPIDDIKTLQIIRKLLDDDILLDVTTAQGSTTAPKAESNSLNAWLAGGYQPPADAGPPFRRLAPQPTEDDDDPTDRLRYEVDSDDVATLDLQRRIDAEVEKVAPLERTTSSGHWKFHWNSQEDEAAADPETALQELEKKEALRREEEARRLLEQMHHVGPDEEGDEGKSPRFPGMQQSGESPREELEEEDGSSFDNTQTRFISDVVTEGRQRSRTPLSTPVQVTRSIEDRSEDVADADLPIAVDVDLQAPVPALETDPLAEQAAEASPSSSQSERRGQAIEAREELNRELSAQKRQPEREEKEIEEERPRPVTMPLSAEASHDEDRVSPQTAPLSMPVVGTTEVDSAERIPAKIDLEEEPGASEDDTAAAVRESEGAALRAAPSAKAAAEAEAAEAERELEELLDPKPIASASMEAATNPAEELPPAPIELDIARTSHDGEIVRTEYDLTSRRFLGMQRSQHEPTVRASTRFKGRDLIRDDIPTPVPPSEEPDELVPVPEEVSGPGEVTAQEQDEPEVLVTAAGEAPAENPNPPVRATLPEDAFFNASADDFSDLDGYVEENDGWKIPTLVAAGAALLALALWAATWDSAEQKLTETPSPVSESTLVAEPNRPEPTTLEPVVETPEPLGLDRDEALNRAASSSETVETSAREIAMVLSGAEPFAPMPSPEESEMIADGVIPAEEEAPLPQTRPLGTKPSDSMPTPQEVAAVQPNGEPKAEPKTKTAPAQSAGEQTLATRINVLRGLIRQENTAQALTLARELSDTAPNDRTVAFLHGQAALYENRNPEAIENLTRAERLGYRSADLYLELATAYQLSGRRDQAKRSYERFLEIQPTGRNADEVRSILQSQF